MSERVGLVVRQSSLISTEPWGFESDHRFVNAAVLCETTLTPRQVLHATQKIERELGRTHKSVGGHYADRLIDIDILLYDELRVDEPDLQIPHPLMLERDFVMIPLGEIRD
ncbi:MAG: 2-amino-4-hydroxy-6-hydroxymethyldihydropteridine diphosphokinase [Prevotella sp.]|nr:2-amino-4-hydroxy-6-hydroxymethyldihydropteridine diphosphokinase [Prevotella sp.]